MALTTVSAKLKLDNTQDPPLAIVTDTTDYAGQGATAALYIGYIKLEVNTGTGWVVFYDNLSATPGTNPDITPSTSLTNSIAIPAPLSAGGDVVQGDYRLTYVVYSVLTLVNPFTYTVGYTLNFTLPEVCIKVNISCPASTVTSTDQTSYGIYATSVVRAHTIYPDPLLHLPDKTANTSILIYGPNIGTGYWGSEVVSTVTWVFQDGLTYTDEIDGCNKYTIECNTDLCKIFCCLRSVVDKWTTLKQEGNYTDADRIETSQLRPAMYYAELFIAAVNCGKTQTQLDELFALVKKYSKCDGSCCGDDGCPTIIFPTTTGGSGFDVVVDSPLMTVQVVEEIVDGTKYYHLEVNLPVVTTTVVTGTSPIVVTSTQVGSVITYDVSFNGGTLAKVVNQVEIYGVIAPNGSTWDFTPSYQLVQGPNIIDPVATPYTYYLGSNEPTAPASTDHVVLHVSGYQITPGEYTVQANVINNNLADDLTTIKTKLNQLKMFEAEVFWADPTFTTDDFFIRIYYPQTGEIALFRDLKDPNTDIALRIQIIGKTN